MVFDSTESTGALSWANVVSEFYKVGYRNEMWHSCKRFMAIYVSSFRLQQTGLSKRKETVEMGISAEWCGGQNYVGIGES